MPFFVARLWETSKVAKGNQLESTEEHDEGPRMVYHLLHFTALSMKA